MMDKTFEERYKDALNWMREVYPSLTGPTREDAEHYFPELKESEDERIRKDIIQFFKDASNSKTRVVTSGTFAKWAEFLEKQKEQKPSTPKDIAAAYQMGLADGRREQKPAEWSEEDDKIRRNLMSLLYNMRGDRITEETFQKYYPWLKSLRPAKDCSSCAKNLEGYISGRCDAENKLLEQFGALITPEDELHIKPRWKPSKEQMGWLESAVKLSTDKPHIHGIIISLYEQLKRL